MIPKSVQRFSVAINAKGFARRSCAKDKASRLLAIFPAVEHETLRIFHIGKSPVYEVPPVDGRSRPLRIMLHRRPRTAVVDVFVGNRLPRHAIAIGRARQDQRLLNANKSSLAVSLAFIEADRAGVRPGVRGSPSRIPSPAQAGC